MALGFIFALLVPVPGTIAQFCCGLLGVDVNGIAASVAEAAFGAALPAFFLWAAGAIYEKIRHKEGLGFGDVKLIAMMGAFLGLQGAVAAWFLGSVSGSILGLAYIKATKQGCRDLRAAIWDFPLRVGAGGGGVREAGARGVRAGRTKTQAKTGLISGTAPPRGTRGPGIRLRLCG